MYGIKDKDDAGSDDEDVDDIEAAVKKEAAALKTKGTKDAVDEYFTPLKMNVDCLVFFKTRHPIQPIEFVKRICSDAQGSKEPGQFRCRYVNRLTPITHIGKANKTGVLEVAKRVLAPHFKLSAKAAAPSADESVVEDEDEGREEAGEEAGAKPASETPQAEAPEAEDAPAQNIEPVTVRGGTRTTVAFSANNRHCSLPSGRRSATTLCSRGCMSSRRQQALLTKKTTRSTSRRPTRCCSLRYTR
jgi:hypothetical protein